ncbi:hypothetical protein VTN00DRAFT_1274 [Thermoascus crustaceus]|uniref:uncharacterized protein n=1 Tax=Thermoascus crustaceus TaxID=5088 RepID=UPI0037436A6C
MQPPSDAFGHQCRKLAEVLADLRNRASSSSTTAPPPPYSVNAAAIPIRDDTFSDVDCEDEEDGVADATITPITIKIDASISIVGHGNTVVIQSGSSSSASTTGAGTTGSMTSASQMTSSQAQFVEPQQQLLQHRQATLTQLATSVIDALNASRLLEDRAHGRCRPIELNINTGIRIQGSRNVVCARVPDRTASRNAKANEDDNSLGRKRRAQSEPAEIPKPKRLPPP